VVGLKIKGVEGTCYIEIGRDVFGQNPLEREILENDTGSGKGVLSPPRSGSGLRNGWLQTTRSMQFF
jgi:hypothetical protein